MLNDETLKALLEGIIYIAPEPVNLDGIVKVLEGEDRERIKAKLDELVAEYEQNTHGIQIRQVANGYKFSTKAEHHEILRKYVKSLKPLVRLSKPALETLAVIAYRQPATMPEIEEIRGVDSGGVIHTLLEKKLVVTAGRKNVVGRPILYRTSKDFLVHFGLKDVGELPSLKEFEEMAKRALGSEWTLADAQPGTGEAAIAPAGEMVEAPAAVAEASELASLPVGEESDGAPSPDAAELDSTVSEVASEADNQGSQEVSSPGDLTHSGEASSAEELPNQADAAISEPESEDGSSAEPVHSASDDSQDSTPDPEPPADAETSPEDPEPKA